MNDLIILAWGYGVGILLIAISLISARIINILNSQKQGEKK
jgi:hypothetical protein